MFHYLQQLAAKLKRPIQVLGWYHSHPHITVWPSHVGETNSLEIMKCFIYSIFLSDVSTQSSYQLLDPNFIGLIFSCFNDSDKKKSRMQLICFQSVSRADSRYCNKKTLYILFLYKTRQKKKNIYIYIYILVSQARTHQFLAAGPFF